MTFDGEPSGMARRRRSISGALNARAHKPDGDQGVFFAGAKRHVIQPRAAAHHPKKHASHALLMKDAKLSSDTKKANKGVNSKAELAGLAKTLTDASGSKAVDKSANSKGKTNAVTPDSKAVRADAAAAASSSSATSARAAAAAAATTTSRRRRTSASSSAAAAVSSASDAGNDNSDNDAATLSATTAATRTSAVAASPLTSAALARGTAGSASTVGLPTTATAAGAAGGTGSSHSSGISTGGIVAIAVVCSVLGLIAVGLIARQLLHRRQRRRGGLLAASGSSPKKGAMIRLGSAGSGSTGSNEKKGYRRNGDDDDELFGAMDANALGNRELKDDAFNEKFSGAASEQGGMAGMGAPLGMGGNAGNNMGSNSSPYSAVRHMSNSSSSANGHPSSRTLLANGALPPPVSNAGQGVRQSYSNTMMSAPAVPGMNALYSQPGQQQAQSARSAEEGPFADPEFAGKVFVVRRTFEPSLPDELIIFPGDRIEILMGYDDGWCLGENLDSGNPPFQRGVFPRDCVEEDPSQAHLARHAPGSVAVGAPGPRQSQLNGDGQAPQIQVSGPQDVNRLSVAGNKPARRTSSLIASRDAELFMALGEVLEKDRHRAHHDAHWSAPVPAQFNEHLKDLATRSCGWRSCDEGQLDLDLERVAEAYSQQRKNHLMPTTYTALLYNPDYSHPLRPFGYRVAL
ncbi:uncharacterized protein L969DRAFT_105943 [Mixia osmundae IAM 14324]|uniref:SH3 domain-containing protein n=1 Tax=Mixia osmundae (strain CBS 9802 / IAM 14324 / JCM 22182 / KY 12970) TaxID=764103 RepID=G7EB61_MIXOS|nr:uncharacterized protein L969DRAFT_105943 [Mixia osmundae IAM 14324]KEI36561.1 hypothetical protein L969DRAFT_105943 [Mixia osmundae IAM 14324]GAB00072.1 hypothetical protein E5Q_06774 [Mixia osmundae IAM 14324]